MRSGEFECVLQQVCHGRRKHLPIGVHGESRFDRPDGERASSCVRFQLAGNLDLGDELGKVDPFALHGHSHCKAHVGKRVIDDIAQAEQTAIEHRAGGPGHADVAAFDSRDRKHRGVEQIAQLVRESTEALAHGLSAFGRDQVIALTAELGDRVRNGVVEAAVERVKLVCRHRRVVFGRKLGDRLTEIAVIVNDLVYGKSLPQQFAAVRRGGHADLGVNGSFCRLRRARNLSTLRRTVSLLELKRLDELIQKLGYSMQQLGDVRLRPCPLGDLLPATRDQRLAICGEKFVQHGFAPSGGSTLKRDVANHARSQVPSRNLVKPRYPGVARKRLRRSSLDLS